MKPLDKTAAVATSIIVAVQAEWECSSCFVLYPQLLYIIYLRQVQQWYFPWLGAVPIMVSGLYNIYKWSNERMTTKWNYMREEG